MSERDDDFLNQGGDEFDPNADEFQIPEDPHGDDSGSDDFLMESGDDLYLSEEDVADTSNGDGAFFLEDESQGAIDLNEMGDGAFVDETVDGSGPDVLEESEQDQEREQEDEPSSGIGWKALAAIGLVAVVGAGGITYAFLPGTVGSSASQQTERLPEPPPAPPESSDGSGGNGGMTPPPPHPPVTEDNESTGENQRADSGNSVSGPVTVDPFPSSNPSGEMGRTHEEGLARAENAGQFVVEPEEDLAVPEEVPQPVPEMQPPQSEIEVTPFNLDQPHQGVVGAVNDPSMQPAADSEPEYIRALREQRQAFAMLMEATRRHSGDLAEMKGSLNDYQAETTKQVNALDDRVGRLEEMMKKSESSRREEAARAEGRAKIASSAPSNIKAPKAPAEVERIQRILKEHNYRPGEVDGILGRQTRWAIKRLQQEHDLPVTGWMDDQTLKVLEGPKRFSGTYPDDSQSEKQRVATGEMSRKANAAASFGNQWFVRGVTPVKAIVYRPDGASYAVRVGTEIPGMGQVTQLDPEKLHVVTANGVITRR